ncbi:MAG TPA: c-type cytochrome biogenesis protein CcmI [Devosia sp.]|nr:c-type cytochrome biogenesis protein CcmI [Devosia sp.]
MFWLLAIAVTAAACAALYFAAAGRRAAVPADAVDGATAAHFRLQLREIEGDVASGRLGEAESLAARGELARELIRLKGEGVRPSTDGSHRPILLLAIGATALLAFGSYAMLGQPDLPAAPLADRPSPEVTLDAAIARVEARLATAPDDIQGWTVVAPAYMQLGRFADAEKAYRRVLELSGETPDRLTDLAEAIMMKDGGNLVGEPAELLKKATALDPNHVRSRFYLASEATRAGEYQSAIEQWSALLALGKPEDTWTAAAEQGLAAARAGLDGVAPGPTQEQIGAMVEGLSSRLMSGGGSIAEWTQLVRSRLVLGDTERAQSAYDAARAAYPDPAARTELDVLAADHGLVAK